MDKRSNSDAAYRDKLDDCVTHAISYGATQFEQICQYCKGAFPTEVLSAITRLGHDGQLLKDNRRVEIITNRRDDLPEPHPVDYEWRFTKETASAIAEYLKPLGNRVACLGVPTVYQELIAANRDAYLIDRNPLLFEALHASPNKDGLIADLAADLPPNLGHFDVVAMDPPWYLSHFAAWLRNALNLARGGATIVTTIFPTLVRPNAEREHREVYQLLASIGSVSTADIHPVYETPIFERETLAVHGLGSLHRWRVGELIAVKVLPPAPSLPPVRLDEPLWDRFRFGPQVVALKRDPADRSPKLRVASIYGDGSLLLRSVSARDPVRHKIDFWTSRNRCMRVEGRDRLRALLRPLQDGVSAAELLRQLPTDEGEDAAMRQTLALIGW